MMSVPDKVNQYITQLDGEAICDACIVKGLGLTQHAHAAQITGALGTTRDFDRQQGRCAVCEKDRRVIRMA